MNLLKTSLLNGVAVSVKMVVMLILNKVLAIYVGPNGYAAVGQFQNAIQLFYTFSSGAINTGVTKYTSEYNLRKDRQIKLWKTAGTLSIASSLTISLFIFFISEELSLFFLGTNEYSGVFLILAISLPFYILNFLLLAVLNGRREVIKYVLSNIIGSLIGLALTLFLVVKMNLLGALVSLAIHQSLALISTLFICYRSEWFNLKYFFGKIDKEVLKKLFGYTAMALTSAVCVPVSHILIRTHISSEFGTEATGYWEAMWRFSSSYLMLVTTTLSLYMLPRFSELKCNSSLRREILYSYRIIIPFILGAVLFIYAFRDFLIQLLFSNQFLMMRDLFLWQLVGDFFKICSWVVAYVMLARAYFRLYIIVEILFTIAFVSGVVILTKYFGLEGVVMAHALNYLLYSVVMYFLIYKSKLS